MPPGAYDLVKRVVHRRGADLGVRAPDHLQLAVHHHGLGEARVAAVLPERSEALVPPHEAPAGKRAGAAP